MDRAPREPPNTNNVCLPGSRPKTLAADSREGMVVTKVERKGFPQWDICLRTDALKNDAVSSKAAMMSLAYEPSKALVFPGRTFGSMMISGMPDSMAYNPAGNET